MTRVQGGITDARPYFGTMSSVAWNGAEQPAGDFMLATCGCGDWRVLLTEADGSQTQFPVSFYTDGPYVPTGSVTVFGREGENAARGTLDQDAGSLTGDLELSQNRRQFTAQRGEAHGSDVQACVKCHIGENPIFPQPPGHIPYVPGVTNCFECHTLNIQ